MLALCISTVRYEHCRHLFKIYIMPTPCLSHNVVEFSGRMYERPKPCWVPTSSKVPLKRSSYSHTLHSNSSQRWKRIHTQKTQKELRSLKDWRGSVYDPMLFCSTPSLITHIYICSHTAAVLQHAITPTLRSVKERKPRSNSLRTPTVPSVLTQQPPPLWVQVCLLVWRIEGRRHFILHMHISTDTQPHTHRDTHGAMLSPKHGAPPMYKPHTPAWRAGEQARRQDVKMETGGESMV